MLYILTRKQQQIMNLISKGYSNEYISKKLSIEPITLKTHIKNIYREFKISADCKFSQRVRAVLIWLNEMEKLKNL